MKLRKLLCVTTFSLCLLPFSLCLFPFASPARGQALTADEFRLLPLRVHLLRAKKAADLHTDLQEADARRIVGKINGIWRQAGIQFFPEAILAEEAAGQEFLATLGPNRSEAHLRLVRPPASRSDQMVHLYYVGAMRPNGICLQGSYELLFVKESSRLNPVPGGIDEPLPRVSAHEIGHALNLDHRQDRVNLMASGTTGTSLNGAEIHTARQAAEGFSWHLKPAEALQRADRLKAANPAGANDLYATLAGLPGGEVVRAAREALAAREN